MNNNRGNNRRRGRGNNRQQGGQQVNRIDSRARGNAPQLLEKYRKLAHDAHLNGDRVTEEYYLQFADHYFRVVADQKQRQEESRQQRRDDRQSDYADDDGGDDEGFGEGSAPARGERPARADSDNRRQPPVADPVESAETAPADDVSAEGDRSIYEPVENPFVREGRSGRGLKPRKPRRRDREDGEAEDGDAAPAGFDASALPPSISKAPDADPAPDAEEKPKRRRTRKTATKSDDAGGELEAVNG